MGRKKKIMYLCDKPLASAGFKSYRYPSRFGGWVMIAATDEKDALREARRSITPDEPDGALLESWNGTNYERIAR